LRIDVSAHGMGWGDGVQLVNHLGLADVASMDNQVGALQRRDRLRPHQPMRIRNDADQHSCLLAGVSLQARACFFVQVENGRWASEPL
jgi:hypothetical protein